MFNGWDVFLIDFVLSLGEGELTWNIFGIGMQACLARKVIPFPIPIFNFWAKFIFIIFDHRWYHLPW